MKKENFKELSLEELILKRKELAEELFNLRKKNALKQLDNIKSINKTRKNIARILTLINQKKKEIAKEG